MAFFIIFVAIVYIVYGLGAFGLIVGLRRVGVSAKTAIIVGFLVLGIVSGFVSFSMWPKDIGVIFNIPGSLLGDKVYQWSIQLIGDPSSSQAHFTIPWILRIPQVYIVSGIVAWGIIGFLVRLVYGMIGKR